MSQAEDLLNNAVSNSITPRTAEPEIEGHIVVGKDRFIEVPEPLQRIAVQYDHNIETVTFDCPRYWDDHDLMNMYIFVNYNRSDEVKSKCIVKNIRVDDFDPDIIHFEWDIGQEITLVPGPLMFLVCAVQFNSNEEEIYHWNSEINSQMNVSVGLEVDGAIEERYPSIIAELLAKMDAIEGDLPIDNSLTQYGLAADAGVVGERLNEVSTNIENLNTGIESTNASVEELNSRVTVNEERLNEIDNQNGAINEEIEALKQKDIDIADTMVQVMGSVQTIDNEVNILEDGVVDLHAEVQEMKNNPAVAIESGEFTPILTTNNSQAAITSSYSAEGLYYKIGNIVHFNLRIVASNITYEDASNIGLVNSVVVIGGLPFECSSGMNWPVTIGNISGIKKSEAGIYGFTAYLGSGIDTVNDKTGIYIETPYLDEYNNTMYGDMLTFADLIADSDSDGVGDDTWQGLNILLSGWYPIAEETEDDGSDPENSTTNPGHNDLEDETGSGTDTGDEGGDDTWEPDDTTQNPESNPESGDDTWAPDEGTDSGDSGDSGDGEGNSSTNEGFDDLVGDLTGGE